jgi:hypothetical protein
MIAVVRLTQSTGISEKDTTRFCCWARHDSQVEKLYQMEAGVKIGEGQGKAELEINISSEILRRSGLQKERP